MTVGSGVSPDLLTFGHSGMVKALAGWQITNHLGPAYRRWGIAPRPENIARLAKTRPNLQEKMNDTRQAHAPKSDFSHP
jgi:hypothetical protein